MKELKIGDRVSAELIFLRGGCIAEAEQVQYIKGVVEKIEGKAINVKADDGLLYLVSRRQVRHLKKERRRIWLIPDAVDEVLEQKRPLNCLVSNRKVVTWDVEFIEVRAKKGKP